jgi:hypothetical protein
VAYAGNGTVQGDLVYCHQGTEQDFEYLSQQGVSVQVLRCSYLRLQRRTVGV